MATLSDAVESWQAGRRDFAPIATLRQVRPVDLGLGQVRAELTATDRLHNAMCTVHGGISFNLTAWLCAGHNRLRGRDVREAVTAAELLPAGVRGWLRAHARVIRRGQTSAHLCDAEDGEDRLMARATSVYAV